MQVRRQHAPIRTNAHNLKSALRLVPDRSDDAIRIREEKEFWEDQDNECRYLAEVIKAKLSNLTRTNSDIRLLWSVVEAQIKLGEIQPGRLTGFADTTPNSTPERPAEQVAISTVGTDVTAPPVVPAESGPIDSPQSSDVLGIEQFLEDQGEPIGTGKR
jgi:hypothetical protein